MKIVGLGYQTDAPLDPERERQINQLPSSYQTHQFFQGGAVQAQKPDTRPSPGYHPPPWGPSDWRYNPVTGQELEIYDGHGNRMRGN